MDQDPKTLSPAGWVAWAEALINTGRYCFRTARPSQWAKDGRTVRSFRIGSSYEDPSRVFYSTRRWGRHSGRFIPAKWAQSVRLWEQAPSGEWVKRSPEELGALPPAWILEKIPGGPAA